MASRSMLNVLRAMAFLSVHTKCCCKLRNSMCMYTAPQRLLDSDVYVASMGLTNLPLMSSRSPSQLVPLRSVSASVFQVGAPTTRPEKSGNLLSSVSPMSAGASALSPSSCRNKCKCELPCLVCRAVGHAHHSVVKT